jgi:hypothetical protein
VRRPIGLERSLRITRAFTRDIDPHKEAVSGLMPDSRCTWRSIALSPNQLRVVGEILEVGTFRIKRRGVINVGKIRRPLGEITWIPQVETSGGGQPSLTKYVWTASRGLDQR